jgi:hypothetical protein
MISKSNLMIFMFVFLVSIFVTNCSDDEKEDTLIGTWVLTSVKSVVGGITITIDPAEIGLSWRLTVRDDESYTMIMTEAGETTTSNGEWATSGDKIFITEEGETMEFDYSLKGDKLELSHEETEDGTTITVTYVFTRQ